MSSFINKCFLLPTIAAVFFRHVLGDDHRTRDIL